MPFLIIAAQVIVVSLATCSSQGCTLELKVTPNSQRTMPNAVLKGPQRVYIDYLYGCPGEDCPSLRPLLKIRHKLPVSSITGKSGEFDEARFRNYPMHGIRQESFYKYNLGILPVLYNPNNETTMPLNRGAVMDAIYAPEASGGSIINFDRNKYLHVVLWREKYRIRNALQLLDKRSGLMTKSYHWRIRGVAAELYAGGVHEFAVEACQDDGEGRCATDPQTSNFKVTLDCANADKWGRNYETMKQVFEAATIHNAESCTEMVRLTKEGDFARAGAISFKEARGGSPPCCLSNSELCITEYGAYYGMVCVGGVDKAPDFYREYVKAKTSYDKFDESLPRHPEYAAQIADDPQRRQQAIDKMRAYYLMEAYRVALARVSTMGYEGNLAKSNEQYGPDAKPFDEWRGEFVRRWAASDGNLLFGISP